MNTKNPNTNIPTLNPEYMNAKAIAKIMKDVVQTNLHFSSLGKSLWIKVRNPSMKLKNNSAKQIAIGPIQFSGINYKSRMNTPTTIIKNITTQFINY